MIALVPSWYLSTSQITLIPGGYRTLLVFHRQQTAVQKEVPGTSHLLLGVTAAGRCLEPGSGTHQLHRLGASSSLLRIGLHQIPVAESKHNKSLHTCLLVLCRKHFCFSAGLCFSTTAVPSKQKAMNAVKKRVETVITEWKHRIASLTPK